MSILFNRTTIMKNMKKMFLSSILSILCIAPSMQADGLNVSSFDRTINRVNREIVTMTEDYHVIKQQAKEVLKDQYPLVKEHFKAVVALVIESALFKDYACKVVNGTVEAAITGKEGVIQFVSMEEFQTIVANVREIVENNLDKDLYSDELSQYFFDAMILSAMTIPANRIILEILQTHVEAQEGASAV